MVPTKIDPMNVTDVTEVIQNNEYSNPAPPEFDLGVDLRPPLMLDWDSLEVIDWPNQ